MAGVAHCRDGRIANCTHQACNLAQEEHRASGQPTAVKVRMSCGDGVMFGFYGWLQKQLADQRLADATQLGVTITWRRRLGEETMRSILIAVAVFVLSSCATTAKYQASLESWVGKSELELVQAWGSPASSYESNGHKFLAYNSSRNMYLPGMAPTYTTTVTGNTAYSTPSGGYPSQNIGLQCTTNFEIADGVVVRWRYEGNDCTSG